jgi:serine/threonine protein phosphatase PrpC
VWDEVEDQHAVDIVKTEPDPFKASAKLRDFAYLLNSEDNISVIVVKLAK